MMNNKAKDEFVIFEWCIFILYLHSDLLVVWFVCDYIVINH